MIPMGFRKDPVSPAEGPPSVIVTKNQTMGGGGAKQVLLPIVIYCYVTGLVLLPIATVGSLLVTPIVTLVQPM